MVNNNNDIDFNSNKNNNSDNDDINNSSNHNFHSYFLNCYFFQSFCMIKFLFQFYHLIFNLLKIKFHKFFYIECFKSNDSGLKS